MSRDIFESPLMQGNRQTLVELNERVSDRDLAFIPENTKLVDLTKYGVAPRFFESHFKTGFYGEFIDWVKGKSYDENGISLGLGAKGFVYAGENFRFTAEVIFDFGTPEAPKHRNDRALLKLNPSARLNGFLQANGALFKKKKFLEFIHDNRPYIDFYDEKEDPLEYADVVKAIRCCTVETTSTSEVNTGNHSTQRSAFASTAISAKSALPVYANILCAPYEGFDPVFLRARINLIWGAEELEGITLNISNLEEAQEFLGEKLSRELRTDVGAEAVDWYRGRVEG